ncbi:MAG: PIN domain-containing protein [Acidobacteria bacterium]|nr:MAG: PIN domain-containing protein [Acidobacteriota bacterium]
MIVVDASALLELVLLTADAVKVGERIFTSSEMVHAPHVIDLEVTQVIRRYCALGDVAETHAQRALDDLAILAIVRHPHGPLLPRIWQLRHNVTAYDAAYLALAETLDAPLLTRDARLANAPGHGARVELI